MYSGFGIGWAHDGGVGRSSHLAPSGTHDTEVLTEEVQELQELRVLIAIAVPEDHETDNIRYSII